VPVSLLPCVAGLASSLALGSADPVQWMTPLVGPVLGLAMLLVLILANISSLVGMVQGNAATIIQNFGPPLRRAGFAGTVALLCAAAGLIMWLATDALYNQFFSIVSFYGAVFAACVGILLADALVLRRSKVDLAGLHDMSGGPYRFWLGVNPAAPVALLAGFATYIGMLEPVSQTPSLAFRYLSASLPAIAVAFVVHLALSRLIIIPAGLGGYRVRPHAARILSNTEPAE
jgi:NCS1 family nucleobase:cation symporter-1